MTSVKELLKVTVVCGDTVFQSSFNIDLSLCCVAFKTCLNKELELMRLARMLCMLYAASLHLSHIPNHSVNS